MFSEFAQIFFLGYFFCGVVFVLGYQLDVYNSSMDVIRTHVP